MWKSVAFYSPCAFADRRLEDQFNAFRSANIGRDVPVTLSMTCLFWSVSLLRGMSGPSQPWAFATAGFSLAITACTLLVHTAFKAAYTSYWPALHVLVHMAHLPTLVAVHRILINLYSPPDRLTCTSVFNCAHEHMLIFPHFASGIMACIGIPLPLVPQIATQIAVVLVSLRGNDWICNASHVLAPVVHALPDPASWCIFLLTPDPTVPFSAPCTARLAVWEVQAGVLAVIVTLAQEFVSRYRFLAARRGPLALNWPAGTFSLAHCIMLVLVVLIADLLVVSVVVSASAFGYV